MGTASQIHMNKNRVKAVWQLLTRLTTTLQYNPAITLPGIHPTELKNPWPRENLHTNACSTFIQNCPRELVPPEIQWLGLCTFTAEGRRFDPWSGNAGPASQGAWPKKKKTTAPNWKQLRHPSVGEQVNWVQQTMECYSVFRGNEDPAVKGHRGIGKAPY